MSTRVTRSRSRQPSEHLQPEEALRPRSPAGDELTSVLAHRPLCPIDELGLVIPTGMDHTTIRLAREKQEKLHNSSNMVNKFIHECQQTSTPETTRLAQAAASTVVFAQAEAGTAVCISPSGLLLTCAHCVAEDEASLDLDAHHWLISVTSRLIRAKCLAWCPKRDLALLQVTGAGNPWTPKTPIHPADPLREMAYVELASAPPTRGTSLLCIGHPGSEDLESSHTGVKTDYDVLHVSQGRFRGLATGQDVLDNSEIGALKHDCWTYWGHSGAPLVDRRSGRLVGLHSSWDDETGMRRGVALEAVRSFLTGHLLTPERV